MTQKLQRHFQPATSASTISPFFFTINGPTGVHFCLPALLGTEGGRLVGALHGYEGGKARKAGEGTGANLGGGGGRLGGKLGAKATGRGGGGGGGGAPSALSLKKRVGSGWM